MNFICMPLPPCASFSRGPRLTCLLKISYLARMSAFAAVCAAICLCGCMQLCSDVQIDSSCSYSCMSVCRVDLCGCLYGCVQVSSGVWGSSLANRCWHDVGEKVYTFSTHLKKNSTLQSIYFVRSFQSED